MMDILTMIYIFVIAFCVFICFRTNWVYKKRIANSKMVGKLIGKRIKHGQIRIHQAVLLDVEKYLNCIWSPEKMLMCFWIWDLRKMVSDKEKFDEVYATEDLEAVRKRVVPNTHVANLSRDEREK